MTSKRIYLIRAGGDPVALVRAATAAQALRYHTTGMYAVEVATQDELVEALTSGLDVDEAGKVEPPIPTLTDPVDDGHDGSEA